MVGRPGRIKSKGSEASASQEGDLRRDVPSRLPSRRRLGRPRKLGSEESEWGSRDGTPYSPANPKSILKRPMPDGSQLISFISEFDHDEDLRSHRLARFIEEHPECREEYAKWMEERPSFPPWMEERDHLEHDGIVYRSGDIVSLFDKDDDDEKAVPYYAQIRSLIRDQYMRSFAWITWLVPRVSAPDPHEFDAEHFTHSLIDHKMYELECFRWVTDQPELPSYQNFDDHLAAVEKGRLEELRQRRIELYKAANFAIECDADMIRAGDIKLAHTKKHADEYSLVLKRIRQRAQARRDAKAGKNMPKTMPVGLLTLKTAQSASADDSSEDTGEDEDEEEEEKDPSGRKVFVRRATSQESTTTKSTIESAPSSVKKDEPMEEN